MDHHPLYRPVEDLPELCRPRGDGPELALPEIDPETIIAAVVARQAPGVRLQEKVDGSHAIGVVGPDGRIATMTSRAALPLRTGRRWIGVDLGRRWAGWTLIGELEVGTTRAMRRRDARGETLEDSLDPWHIFQLVAPDGRTLEGAALAWPLAQMGGLDLRGRLLPVREAVDGENWEDFARDVLASGGEGLIVRTPDGAIYRAKPAVDFDRVVMAERRHVDRNGHVHRQVMLGVCVSAGARARYRAIDQWLELPAAAPLRIPRHTVVSIIGSTINTETGVVRFARITAFREDKAPWECRA